MTPNSVHLILDIDDTLNDFRRASIAALDKIYPTRPGAETNWDFFRYESVDKESVVEFMIANTVLETFSDSWVLSYAQIHKIFQLLKATPGNSKVTFATARGFHPNAKVITRDQLNRLFLGAQYAFDLVLTNSAAEKAALVSEIAADRSRIVIVVDDLLPIWASTITRPIHGLCPILPWNIHAIGPNRRYTAGTPYPILGYDRPFLPEVLEAYLGWLRTENLLSFH